MKTQTLDDLRLELAMLPRFDTIRSVLGKIHLATDEIMADIPLDVLAYLLELARCAKMDKAVAALEREIELNLAEGERLKEARHTLKEARRMLKETERTLQAAREWAAGLKKLRESIEARLAAQGAESEKCIAQWLDEYDEYDSTELGDEWDEG